MLEKTKFSVLLLTIAFQAFFVNAQTDNISPYTRYGIGEVRFPGLTPTLSMGGTGIGFSSHNMANPLNPASYSNLDLVTFAAGVRSDFVRFSNKSNDASDNHTNLSYLNLSFPLRKDTTWGLSLGLLPYSSVGYNISYREVISVDEPVDRFFQGNGGYNQVYLGTGFKIAKRISFGVNASYIFGNIEKLRRLEWPNSANALNVQVSNNTSVSDFGINTGLQAKLISGEKENLVLGFIAGIPMDLDATNDFVSIRYADNGTIIDTAYARQGQKGQITLPLNLGGGLMYSRKNMWRERDVLNVGADFTLQDWSEFESFGFTDSLRNSYRISLGGQYLPDESVQGSYLQRMYFRFGLRYNQTYLEINETGLQEYGITFGLGLPMKPFGLNRAPSYINIGLELGQRGTTDNNLIQEQFARILIGFTLNDNSWFRKRKYD